MIESGEDLAKLLELIGCLLGQPTIFQAQLDQTAATQGDEASRDFSAGALGMALSLVER